jgi:hypothetical protein
MTDAVPRARQPLGPELVRLQADARYARERYQLYKARVYGPRVADPKRLADLERVCGRAEGAFRRAMSAAQAPN